MGRKQKTETEEELPIDDTVLRVPPKRPQSIITTIMQILLSHPPSSTTDSSTTTTTKTTLAIILFTSFFSLILIFSLSFFSTSTPSPSTLPDPYLFPTRRPGFTLIPSDPDPPSIAYLISGSKGDSARILRILYATYHPKNFYLLHLDLSAHQKERDGLALTVQSVPVFQAAQNVYVIGKADFAYPKGSSPISATLHGAAVLLRLAKNWDWFVSLGATDYPLVTQDDLLHILSYMPKDVNFIHHSSYIGWRESKKLKPIIVDPGLYIAEKTEMFYASQKRKLPSSFQIFSGSSFSILSRSFIEHCILGTDNLPRILMMYFSNTPYSLTNYFQTILCNSHRFNRTVINNNLQFVPFEKPTRSRQLNSSEFHAMFHSGAAFATQLRSDDPALDRIDEEILGRTPGKVVPGGWCLGDSNNGTCSFWGDADILRPGPAAARLETLLVKLLANGEFRSHQCVVES